MKIVFKSVNEHYQKMFTVDKSYSVLKSHKVYGHQIKTDNDKEVWINVHQLEYGEKVVIE